MRKAVTLICLLAMLVTIPGIASVGYAATGSPSAVYQSSAQSLTELTFTIGSKDYLVGKTKKALSAAPFTRDARTLIPIRYVVEEVGGSIEWNQEAQETSITVGATNIIMKVGESTASVNGVVKPIDSTNPKVMSINVYGRVFIPLRFVLEAINAEVVWNPYEKTVVIRYPKPELKLFDHEKFSIKYLENWSRTTEPDGETFFSPEGNSIVSGFESLDTSMTAAEYYAANLKEMKESLKDEKILEQGKVTVSGMEGHKITYTATIEDLPFKITQVFTVKGKTGYVLTYMGLAGMYANYSDSFALSLESYTIK